MDPCLGSSNCITWMMISPCCLGFPELLRLYGGLSFPRILGFVPLVHLYMHMGPCIQGLLCTCTLPFYITLSRFITVKIIYILATCIALNSKDYFTVWSHYPASQALFLAISSSTSIYGLRFYGSLMSALLVQSCMCSWVFVYSRSI